MEKDDDFKYMGGEVDFAHAHGDTDKDL
jgi:solute carrier family 30 (zinc transporter), member 2